MDAETQYAKAMELYRAGTVKESVAEFERARAAFVDEGNELRAATVANDMGVVYYLTGRKNEARQVLEDASTVFEKRGDAIGQAKALGNLAQLMNKSGDKSTAEKDYTRAAELFHRAGERNLEHDTYRALSQMHLQRGRWLEALAAYDLALAATGGSGLLRGFLQIPLRLLGMRK